MKKKPNTLSKVDELNRYTSRNMRKEGYMRIFTFANDPPKIRKGSKAQEKMDINYLTLYPCIDRTVKVFLKDSSISRLGKDELIEFYKDYCLDRIFNRLDKYRELKDCNYEAWLSTVVRNLCKDCHQSSSYKFMTKCEEYNWEIQDKLSLDEISFDEEQSIALYKGLDLIKDRESKLLKLYFFEECSYRDISRKLGLNLSSIGRTLHRAKESLKKRLEFEQLNHSQAA